MTKILRKTCSSLIKIISDGDNNFTQNKHNKLQKTSAKNKWFFAKNKCKTANMGSSTVHSHGVDLIDMQIQNLLWKPIFILCKTHVTIEFQWKHYNIRLQGLDIIDSYTNSIVEMSFYLI